MAGLGIRGANPIWSEIDLQGKLFDGTCYLFVLENTIPYMPATVWHDPDMSIEWTQPIQFLANGTLPIDIYYAPGVTYRLEFRRGDTQQDPLLYEVDNYVPGSGGSTPIDSIATTSNNEITNPQFALYNLPNPYTFTGSAPSDPIKIGPGWELLLEGSGSVTISQEPLNEVNKNPSNAPYALHMILSGWTPGSVMLRQRFQQNGMLWAQQFVSTAVTALTPGEPQPISAELVDSQSTLLGAILNPVAINGTWNEYTDSAQLPVTTNANIPPAAYIDYLLKIPSNIDIYLTSIQIIVQDIAAKPSFQQDSINRQIDYTYNTAYPIIPVGTIITYGGFKKPDHYLLCDGTAYSRSVYNALFQAITSVENVTLTSASKTFTVADGSIYRIGMGVESENIPANTIITAIVMNNITMSAAASATGPVDVRILASNRTYLEEVSLTSTGPSANQFTVYTSANYAVGMYLRGVGIPFGTTITNITGPTITMSNNATMTTISLVSFYVMVNGDGSSTFNVFATQDCVMAGNGGVLIGDTPSTGIGARGGLSYFTMTTGQMPAHNHPGSFLFVNAGGSGNQPSGGDSVAGDHAQVNVASQGNGDAISLIQPTMIMNMYIRYE